MYDDLLFFSYLFSPFSLFSMSSLLVSLSSFAFVLRFKAVHETACVAAPSAILFH